VKKLRITVDIPFERLDQPEPVEIEVSAPPTAKISVEPGGAVSVQPASGDDVPPDVLAVIMATAAQMLGSPIRVHRIRYRGDHGAAAGWTQQGRVAIMTSHTPRR
jgi:hypothetical protein